MSFRDRLILAKCTVGILVLLFTCGAVAGCGNAQGNLPSAEDVTSGSTGDHHEDDVVVHDDTHVVRDPATQPCDLSNWRGFTPDLRECVLPGVNLDGENLRRVDLSDADLTGTTFVGADLFTATLVRAKLVNANFMDAHLVSVDLTNSDLTGANFSGADLTNVVLTGATLEGATTDEKTVCPDLMFGPCW